jgi:hypothetical protein
MKNAKKKIADKNEARRWMLHKETWGSCEKYKELRKDAKKVCKKKTKEHLQKQLNRQNERRNFTKRWITLGKATIQDKKHVYTKMERFCGTRKEKKEEMGRAF